MLFLSIVCYCIHPPSDSGWEDGDTWEAGYAYQVGDVVLFTWFGGEYFTCIQDHTSSEKMIPGYSLGWEEFWVEGWV